MIALVPFMALTVGGVALTAAVKNVGKFGNDIQPFSAASGDAPAARGLAPGFGGYTEPPESFPLVDTQKMDGYRVKVRGRVQDAESISAIGSMFDNYDVSDIRQGMSQESVDRLMNRISY